MNYNIVDTDSIEINDNLELEISTIPNTSHLVLTIDNFLKNPDELRWIAEKQIFEKNPRTNLPSGFVTNTFLSFSQIKKTVYYLAENYYSIIQDEDSRIDLQFNLLTGGEKCKSKTIIPHTDPAFCAFVIYLNLPEYCSGGTTFYKHLETGLDHNVEYFDKEFTQSEKYLKFMNYIKIMETELDFETTLDTRKIPPNTWEEIHRVEMKYNRLVMYPGYIFHTAYVEENWFQENKRLNLSGFLK